jgi:L-alanine-DL-glutamate epimerase-like enolase superfamily enzyme
MKPNRRDFLKSAAGTSFIVSLPYYSCSVKSGSPDYEILDRVKNLPVLKRELFNAPVVIETLELLRYKNNFLCRVRSSDGAEGYAVSNNAQMISLYPVLVRRVIPYFIGKEARDLESLIDGVYVYQSNYKMQNLALWIPVATVEFAVLDMLGRLAKKPFGELIGEIHNPAIAVYRANNHRGKTAEESLELIKKNVAETGARALKFKVGGRMSNNADDPPGRTEKLIPLVRKTFGDDMTIYADSNGSFTTDEAIRIGRLMEEYRFDFYEEPVPFDWYEETKQVADALSIPIAGGEQEPSLHMFRWLIGNRALQVVQQDMFYFGGMIRSMRVARMAQVAGLACTPHISGSGLGYLYMMHFVSALPNAGPYHEYKGFDEDIPFECETSTLTSVEGVITVPTGDGLGIELDPEFIAKHRLVTV